MRLTSQVPSIDAIREAFEPVLMKTGAAKAIVFGSYARGQADEYSDLDLIIVADTDLPFFKRHTEYSGVYEVWHKGLDMLIYTPGEFSQMVSEHNRFVERALEEGVVIYER
jgi:predicted nucleotidyltransferase